MDSDEPVIGNAEVKKLEDPVRELEHILGRKTFENQILRGAFQSPVKKPISRQILLPQDGSR